MVTFGRLRGLEMTDCPALRIAIAGGKRGRTNIETGEGQTRGKSPGFELSGCV